jgi:hypothetical protein
LPVACDVTDEHSPTMAFDPTRPSSDRNRARPLTAADAFAQSEAKSRIMMSRNARRIGFTLAAVGAVGTILRRASLNETAVLVRFPNGLSASLTLMQVVSVFLIPIGLVVGVAGLLLHRRYTREAMANPITAGIFDPSVEWPEEPEGIRLPL